MDTCSSENIYNAQIDIDSMEERDTKFAIVSKGKNLEKTNVESDNDTESCINSLEANASAEHTPRPCGNEIGRAHV